MGKFLDYDSFLNKALRKVADCFCLSLLWTLCCIPLVTIGAATTALYYATTKSIRFDRGGIWHEYWHAFRVNFKQATLIWLVLATVFGLLIMGCYSAYLLLLAKRIPGVGIVFLLILVLYITMWASYLFPHMAKFQCQTKQMLKNCELIALMNFGWSLLLVAIFLVALLLLWFVPLGLLFVPAVYMWSCSFVLEHIFKKYMLPEDIEKENAYSQ